jgi:H+-transporting ATPase
VDTTWDLLVDQSALTGESITARKTKGDEVFSSTVVKQGQQRAIVTKTGSNTYIGRAAHLIANTEVNREHHHDYGKSSLKEKL